MRGGRRHRILHISLVVALVAVAAAVGGVALYASTSEDSTSGNTGGTSAASTAATPAAVIPNAVTPKPSTGPTPSAGTPSTPSSASPALPALWQRTASPAAPLLTPVLPVASTADPTTAGLTATLTPLLADHAFAGDTVAMLVADAASGQVLFSHAAAAAVAPASTAKLAVAVAALTVLGPDHRIYTAVRQGAQAGEIVLVGGGDPTLAGPSATGVLSPGYPAPASLAELASQTAAQLHKSGSATVSLGYDASLFVGPEVAPEWKPIYQTEGDVAPVSALEVDEGSPNLAKPGRVADPALAAASEFATLLTADGIKVTGAPRADKAPATPVTLAAVESPPVSELVQRMLGRSDNDLAEALARQVAIASGQPASFVGGVTAVKAALATWGIDPTELSMVDASGLSPLDRVTPGLLVQLMHIALVPQPDRTDMSAIFEGMPVAGFYGTLSARYSGTASAGAGVIRAKTGTLDGVVALAGYLQDSSGVTLEFVTIANGVAKTASAVTEEALDRLTASLPACGCR
ncbi:MAG TPA: D-alanyl-D-alanine carboxypeptidase/D-alanyl-D-alanine-endopeptidase [Acidothermaceae bacterium]